MAFKAQDPLGKLEQNIAASKGKGKPARSSRKKPIPPPEPSPSKTHKSGPKFVPVEREEVLLTVARLARSGYNQFEIGRRVGLAQPTVSLMLKEVRERYKQQQLATREEHVQEELAALDDVQTKAEEAFELSQQSSDPEEVRAGEAAFLRIILDCRKARRELIGTDAPTRTQTANVTTTIPWDDIAQLTRPPKDVDAVDQKLAEKVAQLPAPPLKIADTNGDKNGSSNHHG